MIFEDSCKITVVVMKMLPSKNDKGHNVGLSLLSCPSYPVPLILSLLSCPSYPVPLILSLLSSPSYPVPLILSLNTAALLH
jgi:hypothetical protein